MSGNETQTTARQVMDGLDRHDLDAVYALYSPMAMFTGWGPQPMDKAGNRQFMAALLEAFPDSRFSVEDLIVCEDKAVARHRLTGTHNGEFMGIPPTGRPVSVEAVVILTVKDRQVIEGFLVADNLSLLQQLGVVPVQAG